jgi:PPOX class probable F420-dependent enzyme
MLPELLITLLDHNTFFVLSTTGRDGAPQSSVIWATREDDEIVFSTIRGRVKTRNMERNPQVSLCAFDPSDPYRYVEVQGVVSLTEDGGPELIQELSLKYDGADFRESDPANIRVVCRVRPTKIFVR